MSGEQLTAAEAAKKVKREVPTSVTGANGKVTTKINHIEIEEKEVLDFKQYDDRVVVVTVDGQKFEAAL